MAILVDADTKVICQGITGSFGKVHTRGCHLYGTKMAGGVTPGKGGTRDDNGLPIFDTVREAADATGATATMIFVPPNFAADAVLEAAEELLGGHRKRNGVEGLAVRDGGICPEARRRRAAPLPPPVRGVAARVEDSMAVPSSSDQTKSELTESLL